MGSTRLPGINKIGMDAVSLHPHGLIPLCLRLSGSSDPGSLLLGFDLLQGLEHLEGDHDNLDVDARSNGAQDQHEGCANQAGKNAHAALKEAGQEKHKSREG